MWGDLRDDLFDEAKSEDVKTLDGPPPDSQLAIELVKFRCGDYPGKCDLWHYGVELTSGDFSVVIPKRGVEAVVAAFAACCHAGANEEFKDALRLALQPNNALIGR